MEQIKNLLPNTELTSSDDRPYVVKQAEWRNNETGNLNEIDGIDCPICKNKGVIYIAEPPNPVLKQKACSCKTKRDATRYMRESGLEKLLDHRVSTYETPEQWQKSLKTIAIDYVKTESKKWFCLLGQSGAGKTHLCSAVAKTFLDHGVETKYVVWNTFIRELKSDMLNDKRMMYKFQKVPVLYIDDFLKGRYTDTDMTLAFDLINYRYNNDLTTLITSELSFGELMAVDAAVAGRIKEKCGKFFVEIAKEDSKNYRLK